MSGCLLCLHLDLGLKTGFEFKVEVVLEHCDPLDQPPDHPFVVIRHRLLMFIQFLLHKSPIPPLVYAVISTSQASMNRRSPLA